MELGEPSLLQPLHTGHVSPLFANGAVGTAGTALRVFCGNCFPDSSTSQMDERTCHNSAPLVLPSPLLDPHPPGIVRPFPCTERGPEPLDQSLGAMF